MTTVLLTVVGTCLAVDRTKLYSIEKIQNPSMTRVAPQETYLEKTESIEKHPSFQKIKHFPSYVHHFLRRRYRTDPSGLGRLVHFHFQTKCKGGMRAKQLYYHVSDTDKYVRFNHGANGSSEVLSCSQDETSGIITSRIVNSSMGKNTVLTRFPFEFEINKYFSFIELYENNMAFKVMVMYRYLEENSSDNTTIIHDEMLLESAGILSYIMLNIFAYRSLEAKMKKSHNDVLDFIDGKKKQLLPPPNFKVSSLKEIQNLSNAFKLFSPDENLNSIISSYLLNNVDEDLSKIKLRQLSEEVEIDVKRLISFFVKGAKTGFFSMSFCVLCPLCKGSNNNVKQLKELRYSHSTCPTCNLNYDIDFESRVEVIFTPTSIVKGRDIPCQQEFCVGSPSFTRHVLVQKLIPNGQHVSVEVPFEYEGNYTISTPQIPGFLIDIRVDSKRNDTDGKYFKRKEENLFHVNLQNTTQKEEIFLKKTGKYVLHMMNSCNKFDLLVRVSEFNSQKQFLSVFDMLNNNDFKEYFGDETLQPGQSFRCGNVGLIFTDLKSSTRMYQEIGDSNALNLVLQHFDALYVAIAECSGAVVKTIGDAVMASFSNPIDTLKCGIRMHLKMQEVNKTAIKSAQIDNNELGKEPPVKLILKVGMHFGPVLAVNQNNRIDFFGGTVNLAARTEGKCNGNDIVMTRHLFEMVNKEIQMDDGLKVEHFEANLKGISSAQQLTRITFQNLETN